METSEFDLEMQKLDEPNEEYVPLYKMVSDNKIAVSKKEGVLWKDRLDLARKETEDLRNSWDNIIRFYKGDNKPSDNIEDKRLRIDEQVKTFENLVWANTNGISRETVMKLPKIEVTCDNEENADLASAYEKLVNNYMGQVGNCGLNCKEKLQKVDITAQLTNRGIWRLDWFDGFQEDMVRNEISRLESELADCKDVQKIKDIEGKLYGLNEKLEGSGFSGVQISLVDPRKLFIDPNSQLESGLDADWIIEERIEYESVVKAKYGEGKGTVYAGEKSEIGSEEEQDLKDYAYGEEEKELESDKLKTVKCYYIWDRLKKRVYLYEDGKWDYPLWVWNDPYGLRQFFPYYVLSYNQSLVDGNMMSEVAYYLPLVNSVNKINSQIDKARDRAFGITFVDKGVRFEDKDLQNYTSGKEGFIRMQLSGDKKITDCIMAAPTPGTDSQLLMDKSNLYQMIAKMSSADNLTRGEEYKTNTTNGAIQQYNQSKKIIIGIKIDKVMNFYVRVCKDVLQLILNRFDMNSLLKYVDGNTAMVINSKRLDVWSPELKFVGDDTIEPTSAVKKQEAMQLTQMMGQFAGACPAVVPVVLKMLGKAFNELVVTDDDWRMIMQSFEQQQQQAMMQQQQAAMQQQQMQQQGQLKAEGMQMSNMAKQQAMQQKMIQSAAQQM